MIIADGFSCREQIRQCTERQALHLAQVLELAFAQDRLSLPQTYPEARYVAARQADARRSMVKSTLSLALLAGGMAAPGAFAARRYS